MTKKVGKNKEKAAHQDIELLARTKCISIPECAVEELKLGCLVLERKRDELIDKAHRLGLTHLIPRQLEACVCQDKIYVRVNRFEKNVIVISGTTFTFDRSVEMYLGEHDISVWQKLLLGFPDAVADIMGQIQALDERLNSVSQFLDNQLEALAANVETITRQMKREYAEFVFDEF